MDATVVDKCESGQVRINAIGRLLEDHGQQSTTPLPEEDLGRNASRIVLQQFHYEAISH